MKSTPTLRYSIQKTRSLLLPVLTRRLFLLTLVSFIAVAALLGIGANANKANRAAKERAEQTANSKSAINPISKNSGGKQPLAPPAVAITATNRDSFPDHANGGKAIQGDQINYSVAITNTATRARRASTSTTRLM